MEEKDRKTKKLTYNKKWIATKRQKRHHTKQLALETTLDISDTSSEVEESSIRHLSPESGQLEQRQGDLLGQSSLTEHECENVTSDSPNNIEINHSNDGVDENDSFEINSSDSDESDIDFEPENLREPLREWVNLFEIKANAVDHLLKLLHTNGHQDLPVTSRTLLKTPRDVELKRISNVDYFYFGFETMLTSVLNKYPPHILDTVNKLDIMLNIDGFPVFKSSNCSSWPVLGAICNLQPCKPFPVTITVGNSKPSNLDFLDEAIGELQNLIRDGFLYNMKRYQISLKCVVCDAPAKSFVKCVKQYSGYYGCDRCTQRGLYVGRMTYPVVENLTCRTDQSFRNQDQEEHHKGLSPFLNLQIDLVNQFPMDYMHQVCLGVTKKLILTWMRGPKKETKLSNGQIEQISLKLVSLKEFIPQEFARKPRSLAEVDRWKATEFRQFLLYTGQFALKQVLPEILYQHFMCLSVALNIMVNKDLATLHLDYAHQLLTFFVQRCKEIYGEHFLVYNIHSLVHLRSDVERYGSLDNCAAWMFENYMQQLKRKVRSGSNPAAQLVKRIKESLEVGTVTINMNNIKHKKPNNAYRTDTGKYCDVIRCTDDENNYLCRVYHTPENLFCYPCNSSLIGHAQFRNFNYEIKALGRASLITRCIKIQMQRNFTIFIPLQHTWK